MAGLFGKVSGLVSGYLNDPAKLEPIITQCFGVFDKDKSGFVEGPEVKAAAQMVIEKTGISGIPVDKIDLIFNKVAGPDQKVDKEEFGKLVHELLKHAGAEKGAAPAPV